MSGLTGLIGGAKKPTIISPMQQTPQYVQDAYADFFDRGINLSNQTAPFAPINNPFYQEAANWGARGPEGFGFLKQAKSSFDNAGNFLQDASRNVAAGTNPITSGMLNTQTNELMNPFTSNVIDKLRAQFDDRLGTDLSNVASNSTLAGAFGSNRAALEGGQARLANNRAFGETSGTLMNSAYQSAAERALKNLMEERNRFLTGAGINVNQANTSTDIGRAALLGNERNQQNNMDNVNRLKAVGDYYASQQQQQQQIPLKQLDLLKEILAAYPMANNSIQYQKPDNPFVQLGVGAGLQGISNLGGIAGIASGIGSFFSDRNLKENIVKVGEKNGLNIYEFNYKGTSGKWRGVIAQEVKEICPEAVSCENGYYTVNYDKIGIPFGRVA